MHTVQHTGGHNSLPNAGLPRFGRKSRPLPKDIENQVFDTIIVGGAINGSAIARDLALRGFSVAIVDKSDPGRTTNKSSRLIHPGLRYLQYLEFPLVLESMREIKRSLKNAPHLVRPVGMLLLSFRDDIVPHWKMSLGMKVYDLFAKLSKLPPHKKLTKAQVLRRVPELTKPNELLGGFYYLDGQAPYVERLCIENLRDARDHRAHVLNHANVTQIVESQDAVAVHVTDDLDGKQFTLKAKTVVNATGAQLDTVIQNTVSKHKPRQKQIDATKGTHIVVPNRIDLPDALYSTSHKGYPFFIEPFPVYNPDRLLIGTTDERKTSRYPEKDEVEYLIEATNQRLNDLNLTTDDVQAAMSGHRPNLSEPGKSPHELTRRHIIRRIGNSRIFLIIGGKITTSRNLAEQTGNQVSLALASLETDPKQRLAALKARFNCKTRTEPLPGGRGIENIEAYRQAHLCKGAKRYGVPKPVVEELINRYGSLYTEVLDLTRQNASLKEPLTATAPLIKAQVLHAIRYENAETLMDIFTESLKMDLLPNGGLDGLEAAADILACEKDLTPTEKAQDMQAYRDYLNRNMAWRT